jgi:hypothetical protein
MMAMRMKGIQMKRLMMRKRRFKRLKRWFWIWGECREILGRLSSSRKSKKKKLMSLKNFRRKMFKDKAISNPSRNSPKNKTQTQSTITPTNSSRSKKWTQRFSQSFENSVYTTTPRAGQWCR